MQIDEIWVESMKYLLVLWTFELKALERLFKGESLKQITV